MPTVPPPKALPLPSTGWRWALAAWLLIFGVHTTQAIQLFPSWRSIFDPESPVVMVDHAIHEYHGTLGAQFFRDSGTTWGLDPYFMAGYPESPVWDSSSNPSILFALLGGSSGYRSYKVGLLVSSILLLVVIAGGSWASGMRAWSILVTTGLAWFVFWAGFAAPLWRTGLFAFVSASAGVGLLLGLCVRFDRRASKLGWVALSAAGVGLFFTHVTAPVLAGGGALAFYLLVAIRHRWRWHLAVLGAVILTVLFNGFWLVSLWRFRTIRSGSGLFMTTDSARFLLDFLLSPSIEGRTGLVLLILGAAGLIAWSFTGRGPAAAAFGGSIVSLIALTAFGSLWEPTKTLEPLRFRVPFYFLLTVPAGSAVAEASGLLARWVGSRAGGRIAVGLVWVAILGAWAGFERPFFQASAQVLTTRRPLAVGIEPEFRQLVAWIKSNTDNSARILFEDQLRLLESTDPESVHWTPLLPFLLRPDDRMFIGGVYQTAFIKHHERAAFGDFQLGDRPIDEWSAADLKRYNDQYNIGWVICWSPLSRFWFDHFDAAIRVATLPRYGSPRRPVSTNEHEWNAINRRAGLEVAKKYMFEGENTYAIYRVERPHSFFSKGKGRIVRFEPNRIELADLEPENGAVVLSLHWLETWQTDPPMPIRAEPTESDPVDFLRITLPGPTPRLTLFNAYRRP